MPFRPPKKQPQFADLKGILAQTKETENPLYQTIQILIERLTQFQQVTLEQIDKATGTTIPANFATRFATYHTKEDETAVLPNSIQLLPGVGIAFDDTFPNMRIINSLGVIGGYYDSPLTDGNIDDMDLISADGDVIIVQVPVP